MVKTNSNKQDMNLATAKGSHEVKRIHEFSHKIAVLFLLFIFIFNDCVSFANSIMTIKSWHQSNHTFFYLKDNFEHKTALKNKQNEDPVTESVSNFIQKSSVHTSGVSGSNPTQGESSSFSIGSTDGMVDKFTGDFSYSIPLMDVDGYPLVLTYNSNVGMMSEASWVGLGWDLNVGSVSREMRGVPDEYNGNDVITRTFNQLQSSTDGYKTGGYLSYAREIGFDNAILTPSLQVTALFGKYNNSYLGTGKTFDFGLQASLSISDENETMSLSPSVGIGYSRDTKNGIGKSHNFGLEGGSALKNNYAAGIGITYGSSFNSRKGVIDKSFGLSVEGSKEFRNKSSIGASLGSSTALTFGTATSIPRVMFDLNSTGHTNSFNAYVSYKALSNIFSAGFLYNDFVSQSKIVYNDEANKQIFQPAYGYLHSSKRRFDSNENGYPVMDYERTRDFQYSENMKNLSFSTQTFDVFSVNASGIGGTFRAGRTDFGTYYDPKTLNSQNAASELLIDDDIDQVGAGVVFTAQTNIEASYSSGTMKGETNSENWKYGVENLLEFEDQVLSNNFDNTTYFKQVGELTPNDLSAYLEMSANVPEFFDVNKVGKEIKLTADLKQQGVTLNSSLNTLNSRPVRASQFLPRLVNDYLSTDRFYSYENGNQLPINRYDPALRKTNHISSLEVVSADGTSYNFGIPVYSIENSEVTFSLGASAENYSGLVTFNNGDNTVNNSRGQDHYFDRTTMPSYPTAFLLTEMRSSDYVDRTNNGPSLDDVGNYYKFNYTQLYKAATPYTWRFPMSQDNTNTAFFNQGLQGTDLDNMANYTIGKKEIWYLQSLETKNYIVEIILNSSRNDAYGAKENGQLDPALALKSIAKIILYNRNEKLANPNALPLQTVVFEYDHSLCKRTPSNIFTNSSQTEKSGKLTLTSVRIYTGNSLENALKSYDFTYDSEHNYDFDYHDVDGWGNFKDDANLIKKNDVYPYATQDPVKADQYASAWKLVKIENPQSGILEIIYEADRYGYVQDKRAMQHLNIASMTNILEFLNLQKAGTWDQQSHVYQTFNRTNFDRDGVDSYLDAQGYSEDTRERILYILFNNTDASEYYSKFDKIVEDIVPNNVIIFRLDEMISGKTKEEADEIVKENYFTDNNIPIKDLYLKTHVNIKTAVEDLVPTFAKISEPCNSVFHFNLGSEAEKLIPYGVMPADGGGNFRFGYVVVDLASSSKKESGSGQDDGGIALHPVQKAALEFARTNLVDKVYGSCADCEGDLTVDKGAIFGADIYKRMVLDIDYAPTFVSDKSLIRLYDSDLLKFGGNSRVNKITYKDNWSAISTEYESTYEWNYVYEHISPEKKFGVASFEPKQIADENPHYMWDSYLNFNKKFPDESNFTPTPIADALYPNPIVGYEEVRVYFNNSTEKGYSKSKFHTNRELAYSTIEKSSEIDKTAQVHKKNILTGKSLDLFGFTQGYYVQTNDFHGKADEMSVYDKNDVVQSRSKYHYYGLGEAIPMMNREGGIEDEHVALEFDMHGDSRFVLDDNRALVVGLKVGLKLPTLIPYFRPIFSINSREQGFYSNTLIKHMNYSAVVKSIETETLGSINTAENILYDKFSGNVILSSLNDEYNDKLYSMNYPSHWYYDELKELTDMKSRVLSLTLGANATFTQTEHILSPGDLVKDNTTSALYRVAKNNQLTTNNFFLINENGTQAGLGVGVHSFTILSCNRNNRLGETMQSITTKKNPYNGTIFTFPETEILSASVLTYRDKLNVRCGDGCGEAGGNNNEVEVNSLFNPYQYGVRGDLVMDGQYSWQSERNNDANNHGIRFDGTFKATSGREVTVFTPFYKKNGTDSKWYQLSQNNHPQYDAILGIRSWRKMGEVTLFDPYGNPLESKDQIDVFSSVLYGYNSTLNLVPVASAVNARLQQIAFDGFEDYFYYQDRNCPVSESHFDFRGQIEPSKGVDLDLIERHSGLISLKLDPGKSVNVLKSVSPDCVTLDQQNDSGTTFNVESCDCIKTFEPMRGEYIVGLWVKDADNVDNSGVRVQLALNTNPVTYTNYVFYPTGKIIEGWRRVEGVFNIPTGATSINVTLFNSTASVANFDDVRIHPILAGMTTVVYDPKTLLPLATHDGYNFTTFYNYDENLQQARVKVETIEGIKTIVESESGGKINYSGQ